ncbi:hypothetical protein GQ43DRAFT_158756 [Delitschia confertaspora ATCC 74209]|uniref:Uncharacterized protein n=1 Tax=Delitschia confertaspora ATCC 74209 TaxID=1513339 RepID=A0A9P4K0I1_9PLEO|nr:hypothetical protein GQ43DRAFT_158756 [Delitschia confertaspora ATCC 74209]
MYWQAQEIRRALDRGNSQFHFGLSLGYYLNVSILYFCFRRDIPISLLPAFTLVCIPVFAIPFIILYRPKSRRCLN